MTEGPLIRIGQLGDDLFTVVLPRDTFLIDKIRRVSGVTWDRSWRCWLTPATDATLDRLIADREHPAGIGGHT